MATEDPQYEKLKSNYQDARGSMRTFRERWGTLLDIAYARLSTEKGFKSRVREGSLSSLIWERSARVVAQLPTGRVRSLSTRDEGKSLLMDLVWTKHIIPNANTDYSFKIKLRMWDYYSLVYGAMPMFYDYRIDDEYVGPDATLLDPRYCFPEAGRTSLQSCQRVYVESYHNREWLEARKSLPEWDSAAIDKILKATESNAMPANDPSDTTPLQEERGQGADLHKGQIKLVTMYERGKEGRWITFAPDPECVVLRNIQNPHESGRIPVVFKYAMPLIDSIWGMGDIERGESLQKAVDTAVNLNLDFGKFKLYPPMWYTDGQNKSQLRYEPNAKWKLSAPWGQSAGFVNPGGQSSNEFQIMYQFLKGALLNQNGTTDATISSDDKIPGQGKTPQALERIEKRENARDQWDRDMFDEAFTELANGMINLVGTKQSVPMDFHIFDEDVQELVKSGFKDILEIYDSAKSYKIQDNKLEEIINDQGVAKVTIQPERLGGKYIFQMDSNSSKANDESEEFERIKGTMEFLSTPTGAAMMEAARTKGREVHLDELLNQYFISAGFKNREKIFSASPEENSEDFNPDMITDPNLKAEYERLIGGGMVEEDVPAPAPEMPAPAAIGGPY